MFNIYKESIIVSKTPSKYAPFLITRIGYEIISAMPITIFFEGVIKCHFCNFILDLNIIIQSSFKENNVTQSFWNSSRLF